MGGMTPAGLSGNQFPPGSTSGIVNTVPVSSTGVTPVIGANANRQGLLLVNISASDIWISFNQTVGSANGILLIANGGFFSLNRWEDFDLTGYPFYAIAASGPANLLALENTAY